MGYINRISRSSVIAFARGGYFRTIEVDNAAETIDIANGRVALLIVVRFPAGTNFRIGLTLNGEEILPDEAITANEPQVFNIGLPMPSVGLTRLYFGGCIVGGTIDVYSF